MTVYQNSILQCLSKKILHAINKNYQNLEVSETDIYTQIGDPPNTKLGHFAYPCFNLAKLLKTSPVNIAQELKESIESDQLIKKALNVGPYLNFFIYPSKAANQVIPAILDKSFFKQNLCEKPLKIMVEYSQPNTHKILHVGHMRNLCLGNSLTKIFRYCGHQVITATYPGDLGAHVAKCLWYLKYRNKEPIPEKDKGAWLGKMYTQASLLLEEEKGTDQEEKNRRQLTDILKEIESEKGEFFQLWKETRQWSLDLFRQAYSWADVTFDRWYSESEVNKSSLQRAKDYYQKAIYIESEGAIGMDLSKDNLGFCMMIKSDGTGMYSTKDVELAYQKFSEFDLDKSIYIVDVRQSFHFQQVFKVLEKIGHPHAEDCKHLQYDFVELPSGAMSSRKGAIVPLGDLINEMENTIKKEYLSRYKGEWSEEEIEETAQMVANSAIKYGMIRLDSNRKIVFQMHEWLKLDGETGPYLQYVYARINSLCKKQNYNPEVRVNWDKLTNIQEEVLILKLIKFNDIILSACQQEKTNLVCSYLYELGKLFNNFYVECTIAKAEDIELKNARLALAKAVGLTMKQGLNLLGIPSPDKM